MVCEDGLLIRKDWRMDKTNQSIVQDDYDG